MTGSFIQQLFFLFTGIGIIVLLTSRFKVHPFFALVIVSFLIGLTASLSAAETLTVMKEGFGHIMKSLGFIIVLGTTLGILLERSGSTLVIANYMLKTVGSKNSPLAMSMTGFVVGLPIFCDSGFIVLSGLNLSLARKAGISIVIMATALATGLYAVHCLIPPHPGASAATSLLHADFGNVILLGILVAIPASAVGLLWAVYAGKKIATESLREEKRESAAVQLPSLAASILPVVIPIVLIAIRSFSAALFSSESRVAGIFNIIGDPVFALSIGILICLPRFVRSIDTGKILQEAAEKSGAILVIIGAGGAFGGVLSATRIGEQFSHVAGVEGSGVLFPFLLAFLLKTAQGSSTVAIITAATIVQPLLATLGLDSENGRVLCVLAMGAGSMLISHANDAYFWVISNFQKIPLNPMLRVYSIATIWMGVISFVTVYVLSVFLL